MAGGESGHFLLDIASENVEDILDFRAVYEGFLSFLHDQGYAPPWSADAAAERLLDILQEECGVKKKTARFQTELFGGKISREGTESFPSSAAAVVALLSGGKGVKPKELFCSDAYAEAESVSLTMNDEDFARKYRPEKFDEIFRGDVQDNYLCYSRNTKSLRGSQDLKFCGKEKFCDFLLKRVKDIPVSDSDRDAYEDMLFRLQQRAFLPKQRDGDNRVIPRQLYRMELEAILDHAQRYLPLLRERDADGVSAREKILAVFDFRVPYFVGPLKTGGKNAWAVRRAEGKLYPWNFETLVDLDESEKRFIDRMTNRCTYLRGGGRAAGMLAAV